MTEKNEKHGQANYALYFHVDGYTLEKGPLVGRRAVGQSFLNAWIAATRSEDMVIYADGRKAFAHFSQIASAQKDVAAARFIPRQRPADLAEIGTLYWPTPVFGTECWRRAATNPAGWSIMGVTHTTASAAVMESFANYAADPIRDFDAVICTSRAVKATVERVLTVQEEHLRRRLGATRFERPQLPVIPLGINVQSFTHDTVLRAATRRELGIGEDDICVLFLGRLSYHAKAHHIPFYRAVEKATKATKKSVHILLVGWFANDTIERRFREGAQLYCPSVTLKVLDGRDAEKKMGGWQAGDIFCSLVDNIQETFGLTPVEAMAAGMPAVVSDWDGYKETVRDNKDGFRIPTLMPPNALGSDLADAFASELLDYDHYMRDTSQRIVVDVDAAATALIKLFSDAELRRRMGASGRERAKAVFDWPVILGDYRRLAAELNERRKSAAQAGAKPQFWAARLSPFDVMGSYPTRRLAGDLRVAVTDPNAAKLLETLLKDSSAEPYPEKWSDFTRELLAFLAKAGETTIAAALDARKHQQSATLLRLAWLAKWGLIRIGG